jgi:histidinol-phosphate aminotransferase
MAYPECWPVFEKTAAHIGVPVDHILLHMGSEQAIKLVFETYIRPGDKVLLHLPGYAMYPVFSALYQAEIESQEYDAELRFDWEQYLRRIQPGLRMVVVENPNGFLGNAIDMATLERIIARAQACDTLVLVDEAYYLFHRETAVPLLEKFDNLIITRSFSKAFGLAGLRAGCLVSRPGLITDLTKLKPAYELTSISAMILEELLDHPEEYNSFADETRQCLADFKDGVEALGFATSDSVANFLTIRLGQEIAEAWRVELARRNMLIRRPFREQHLRDWVRISTAAPAVQQEALQVLRDIVSAR